MSLPRLSLWVRAFLSSRPGTRLADDVQMPNPACPKRCLLVLGFKSCSLQSIVRMEAYVPSQPLPSDCLIIHHRYSVFLLLYPPVLEPLFKLMAPFGWQILCVMVLKQTASKQEDPFLDSPTRRRLLACTSEFLNSPFTVDSRCRRRLIRKQPSVTLCLSFLHLP